MSRDFDFVAIFVLGWWLRPSCGPMYVRQKNRYNVKY